MSRVRKPKQFVYSLIYSADGDNFDQNARILLFQKTNYSNWFADKYILSDYKHCGFFVDDDRKLDGVNTIYLGRGSPVRSAGMWVFPGGCDDGKGPQFSYVELKQETGLDIQRLSSKIFQPTGENYSVTLIKVSEEVLHQLSEEARRNFSACQEYRKLLANHSKSIAMAKSFVLGNLPPLHSDEICDCRISNFNDAVRVLNSQENCGWFVAALNYIRSNP